MASFKSLHQQHKWFLPLVIVLVAGLIIAALLATKPTPPKKETKEKEWLVSVESIESGAASPQIVLLGRVESPFDTTLSAGIVADILEVPARDGQLVKQGDILVQLDAREINLTVTQRKADISELEAQLASESNRFQSDQASLIEEQRLLDIAQQGVKRQAKLKASNLVAQERFDTAESQRAQQALSLNARKLNIADHPSRLNQLKAKLSRAKTNLNDALIDAERAAIKAPFDGVITGVNVAPGERVQIGQALVSLYDRGNMEVRAQIPDRHVSLINSALRESIEISALANSYGQKSALQLKRLSGQANQSSGGIDAIFTPVNEQHDLILNSALQIQVELPSISDVFTLPLSAIYGTNRVYRLEDGRIQSINVTILGKQLADKKGQDRVIFSSDKLKNDDAIVTTQLPNAISGLKVKPREQ